MGNWNQKRILYEILIPYSKVLESVEFNGFLIDRARLAELKILFYDMRDNLLSELRTMAGGYNFNSSKQVSTVLFNNFKFPNYNVDYRLDYKSGEWKEIKDEFKTTAGADSANIIVLKKLKRVTDNHPFINTLIEYRKVTTLISRFIDGLEPFITHKNRIHPDIFPLTKGGRLSISKPALSQLPSRTELGRMIKQIFIAKDGYMLVEQDLSAVELRGMAWIAKDRVMWSAFNNNQDVHAITTARIFNISYEEARMDRVKRHIGKTINFAIIYGGSADSVQRTLLKDTDMFYNKKECDSFIKAFYSLYQDVKPLQDYVINYILDHQYMKNLFGRIRYFPDIKRKDTERMTKEEWREYRNSVSEANRQGMSHLISSTFTGDNGALKTVKVNDLVTKQFDGRFYMNFYDAFFCEVREDQVEKFAPTMKELLNRPDDPVSIELPSEGGWGKRWSDLK
jgi:DNA polymerase-1